jgi:nicotinate-nucleotide adenylyltransferase
MRVGILGGSFDPVHNGHIALARAALRQLKLDRVYFLLSPRSPFKLNQPLSPISARLEMVRAAVRTNKKFRVGRWELKRPGPSYTADTLDRYHKSHPRHSLFLLMGSDVLQGFLEWKKPNLILRLATLAVARRPGATLPACMPAVAILRGIFPSVSSSNLRNLFASKRPSKAPVPPAVRAVILRRKLYSSPHVG